MRREGKINKQKKSVGPSWSLWKMGTTVWTL